MTDNNTIVEGELNARLLPHADTLLQEWCEIEHEGDEIVMRNPAREDHHLGSFRVQPKDRLVVGLRRFRSFQWPWTGDALRCRLRASRPPKRKSGFQA